MPAFGSYSVYDHPCCFWYNRTISTILKADDCFFFGLFAFYVYLHSLKTRYIVLAMSICFPGIYQKEKFLDICKEMAKSHHSIHN